MKAQNPSKIAGPEDCKSPASPESHPRQQTPVVHTEELTYPNRHEQPLPASLPLLPSWPSIHSYALLFLATVGCLLPFSGRAFHVDDTLFVWAAQNIAKHPLNPYGFRLTWDVSQQPMSDITQNPPLASYYAAVPGILSGWSERALHISFLLMALLLVFGTYRLAAKFTRLPLLAALATLLAPGVLVSASSIMCDTMMLAIWIWASIFWIEGLEHRSYPFLVLAGLLVGASALTKYFGMSLILLLLAYSVLRLRQLGTWVFCLLIPVAILIAYHLWTQSLYGHGLLLGAAKFAGAQRTSAATSWTAMAIVGTSFAGGCALPSVTFAPLLWSRAKIATLAVLSIFGTLPIMLGWADLGLHVGGDATLSAFHQNWLLAGAHLALFVLGGVSLLALALSDYLGSRDADSVFLVLWVFGTFIFATFVNYTVNARSMLPLIPAAGILIARCIENDHAGNVAQVRWKVAAALVISGVVAVVVASADADLANSARKAAALIVQKPRARTAALWFEGHWGFQYYMEQKGAYPLDLERPQARLGDYVVIPSNNIQLADISPQMISSREDIALNPGGWASTIDARIGAGFYSSYWGPLPYVIGSPAIEHYSLLQLAGWDRAR